MFAQLFKWHSKIYDLDERTAFLYSFDCFNKNWLRQSRKKAAAGQSVEE
jgi:hypothetical protein